MAGGVGPSATPAGLYLPTPDLRSVNSLLNEHGYSSCVASFAISLPRLINYGDSMNHVAHFLRMLFCPRGVSTAKTERRKSSGIYDFIRLCFAKLYDFYHFCPAFFPQTPPAAGWGSAVVFSSARYITMEML